MAQSAAQEWFGVTVDLAKQDNDKVIPDGEWIQDAGPTDWFNESVSISYFRMDSSERRTPVRTAAILHRFRERILKGSKLATACFDQIRIKLLKVAGRVHRMKTRVRFHPPESFAFKHLFAAVAAIGAAGHNGSP